MPARNRKKSKTEGLYKQCRHLDWDRCPCPWQGRYKGQRLSLKKWSGQRIDNKEQAKLVLKRMMLTCRVSSDQSLLENGPFGIS